MSDIMSSVGESLKMSRKRAKALREAGCKPLPMRQLMEHMDRNHMQFKNALETMHASADAYHTQKLAQRSAQQVMTEAMEKARDTADKLHDECEL